MLSAILNLAPLQGASFYRDVFRDFLSIHFGIVIRFLRSTNCTVYGDSGWIMVTKFNGTGAGGRHKTGHCGGQRQEFCSETGFEALI